LNINPDKAKFYTVAVLNMIIGGKLSFDKAFSDVVRRYRVPPREAKALYKLLYKVLIYYHTIKFLANYHGFKHRVTGIVDYLYTKGFEVDRVYEEASTLASSLSPVMRISLLYGYPSWFVRDLYGKMPTAELERMLKSLNEKKRWLRVNTEKTSLERALECLDKTGLRVKVHPEIQELLLVEDPFEKIGLNPCVREGLVIPQDISSLIATRLLVDIAGDFIDACSAPGVKLLQVLTERRPRRVLAIDLSVKRLGTLLTILSVFYSRAPQVVVVNADSSTISLNVQSPIILVDAPCSNSGAVYSDPAVKIHMTRKTIWRHSVVQRRILKNMLRHGGKVFFMTCSVHPAEGEELIDDLLNTVGNRAKIVEIKETRYVKRGYAGYRYSNYYRRIYPQDVNGQGFFIAVMEAS